MPDEEVRPFGIPELNAEFVFRRRPLPIPGDLRIAWRIGLITLLMSGCCRSGRTRLTRLHVLNWGIRTEYSRDALLAAVNNQRHPDSLLVRFEPFLNRAVDFALGEGLVERSNGAQLQLTEKGWALAAEIEADESVYIIEKQFIDTVRFRLTEKLVDQIFGGNA